MIQLGFVLFFAAVFPLSPLIVLINNVFFIRMDAFKLTNTRKRPIAHKSAGLGVKIMLCTAYWSFVVIALF
jgi:anoctamin-9